MEQPQDHQLNDQNWSQVTEEVRKKWANLSDDDIQRIEHNYDSLTDLVSLKTGLTHEETEQRLDDIIARCGTQTTMSEEEYSASWKQASSQKPSSTESRSSAGTQGSGTIEEGTDEQAP
ncbi:hypothetical protein ACLVWU_04075 [Bdellovibrio sp. HCB290]|uniref:hypothetical protein n=1 Tax=Bdellovibrio sp. HCB290 TaxID=3394356 RepID=UPI0039B5DDCF